MKGTRAEWAALMPTLQAFVAGEVVQRLDYDGRWVDSGTMHSLLTGSQYRLRPKESRMGVWTRQFRTLEPGSVDGPMGTGEMRWEGSDTDTLKWPERHGLEYIGEAVFTPNA